MLPRLTRRGSLPPGVHRGALSEVLVRFGTGSRQRILVTQRLQRILQLAQRDGWLRRAFLWGSYVTAKAEPNDVDIMLVMASGFGRQHCGPELLKVFDGEADERELGATIMWIPDDMPPDLLKGFLDQWQIDRRGIRRGIVEVVP